MLFKLSDHISNCLERAAQAERRAMETTDLTMRSDNEKLAMSWRQLAASYQFVESLDRFLSDKATDVSTVEGTLIAEKQATEPESRTIIRRHRVKHAISFRDRLLKSAQEAREQAAELPSGAERKRLLLKARQCETAAEIDEWVASPGSPPPDQLNSSKQPKR